MNREQREAELLWHGERMAEVCRRIGGELVPEEELARCMVVDGESLDRGFQYWCDHYCWTHDLRDMGQPHKRFVLYRFQREVAGELVKAMRNGGVVHWEKSREVGASWLVSALITWAMLMWESFHAVIGSRVERYVDDGTSDSLMGKIDYVLDKLPPWMLEEYQAKRRRLLRLETARNVVTGESANKNFGRGPRKNVAYMDEFAFWEYDHAAWTSVSQTSACRIVTSTPNGSLNKFAQLRHLEGVVRLRTHWSDDPRKTEEWYEDCRRLMTPREVAQELDIDYMASAGGIALEVLHERESEVVIEPDCNVLDLPSTQLYGSLDWGFNNPTAFHVWAFTRMSDDTVHTRVVWEYYEPSDGIRFARAARDCPYYDELEYVACDPSMFYYNQTGDTGVTSIAFVLRDKHGIRKLRAGKRGDAQALETVGTMIKEGRLRVWNTCQHLIREWKGLRFETNPTRMEGRRNNPERLVDKDNHSWDGAKYLLNMVIPQPEITLEKSDARGYDLLREQVEELRRMKLTPPKRTTRLAKMFH